MISLHSYYSLIPKKVPFRRDTHFPQKHRFHLPIFLAKCPFPTKFSLKAHFSSSLLFLPKILFRTATFPKSPIWSRIPYFYSKIPLPHPFPLKASYSPKVPSQISTKESFFHILFPSKASFWPKICFFSNVSLPHPFSLSTAQ